MKAFLETFFSNDIFWSFFAMPIGLMVCFTPIVVVWILESAGDEKAKKK